ncbi:MAG TPA: TerB family tellurite resistance protein [Bacteroidia bacterium]
MTPIESLHYALGEMAYAIANADGKVQKEELKKFRNIVEAELRCKDYAFDVSDIIFHIMNRDHTDSKTSYEWAMNQIRLNSHYLSPQLKNTFIRVMEKIAKAFPPVTKSEQNLIDRFKKEIAPINGDPVFFEKAL